MNTEPKPVARWLLKLLIGGRDAEGIDAALAVLFRVRANRNGLRSARQWYRRQVLGFAMRMLLVRGRRIRTHKPGPPTPQFGGSMFAVGIRNLRFASRSLSRQPGFAALAISTIALGIGANTAIFSVVNGVILKPLPYEDVERLVSVWPETVTNVRMIEWFAENTGAFDAVSGLTRFEAVVTGDGDAERLAGVRVTTNHFDVLRVRPIIGRTFIAEESDPGRNTVAILSHALWATRYAADSNVIGRTISLDHQAFTVIGVLPADYRPLDPDFRVWIPQPVEPGTTVGTDPTWWMQTRVGRLAPGVSSVNAETEVRAAVLRMAELYPDAVDEADARRASVIPLQTALVGDFRETLWILFGAVGMVLLIACSNVASLLLARTGQKEREVALRTAVGATRSQVVAWLLAESLLLGASGGAAGLLLASGALQLLEAGAPGDLPRIGEAGLDLTVLAFTVIVTTATPLVFGLVPALRATRLSPRDVLNRSGRGAGGLAGPSRMTSALIAAEVALAVVLVVGAGLMVKTLWKLQSVDPGFRTERLLTMHVAVPPADQGSVDLATYRELWRTIDALPGVQGVGAIHLLPLTEGNNRYPFWADDNEPQSGTLAPVANIRVATPGYLDAAGIGLLEGRWFTEFDRSEGTRVMVINRSLAARLWPSASAVGKRIRLFSADAPPREIVGVIADVRQMTLARTPTAEFYLPHEQWAWPTMYATIHTAGPPARMVDTVRRAIGALDQNIAITRVATMEQVVAGSIASTRFLAALITVFALLALMMGAVGVYGVTSHAVNRRMPEFGIRIALGSSRVRILETAMAHGLAPVVVGLVLGLGGAWTTSRLLTSLLFGTQPTDPMTYGAVLLMLMTVAWVATYLPARRALSLDPTTVLRAD